MHCIIFFFYITTSLFLQNQHSLLCVIEPIIYVSKCLFICPLALGKKKCRDGFHLQLELWKQGCRVENLEIGVNSRSGEPPWSPPWSKAPPSDVNWRPAPAFNSTSIFSKQKRNCHNFAILMFQRRMLFWNL